MYVSDALLLELSAEWALSFSNLDSLIKSAGMSYVSSRHRLRFAYSPFPCFPRERLIYSGLRQGISPKILRNTQITSVEGCRNNFAWNSGTVLGMTARLTKFAREKAWNKWNEPPTLLTTYLGRWWDSFFFVYVWHKVAHGLVVWNTPNYIRESIGNETILQSRSVWWLSANIVSRWLIPPSLWRSSKHCMMCMPVLVIQRPTAFTIKMTVILYALQTRCVPSDGGP